MSLDYRKCFDMLEHSAIEGSLKYFNFGQSFTSWIMLLYKDIQLCTCNNDYLSQYVNVSRSVLQGSPLAAFIYLLTGQILNYLLKNDPRIKGINIDDLKLLLAQFADDTNLFLQFDKISLNAVVDTLDTMYTNTGLTVNYNKTNIYRIGSLANTNARLYTKHLFNWTNEPIKMLGVFIPTIPNNELSNELNFTPIMDKLPNILNAWALRNPTLSGRVLLVNTLIASLFVYKLQVLLGLNTDQLQTFNSEIIKFIWNYKSPKIAHRILIRDKSHAGLRLVEMGKRQYALKAQWMIQINTSEVWGHLFYRELSIDIKEWIWKCNLRPSHVKFVMRDNAEVFWSEILYAWSEYNFSADNDLQSPLDDQCIWYNSNILIDNQPCFFRDAFEAGLIYISDLIDVNNDLRSHNSLIQEFGNCLTWFQYAQLIVSIPQVWKTKIANHGIRQSISKFDRLCRETKISQTVYSSLIDDKSQISSRIF